MQSILQRSSSSSKGNNRNNYKNGKLPLLLTNYQSFGKPQRIKVLQGILLCAKREERMRFYGARSAENFLNEEAPREITAQKTCTVLIVLQHEEAPREATAQNTRTVLIVLQHEEPPREATAQDTRTVLIVLQHEEAPREATAQNTHAHSTDCTTTRQGVPGQSGDVGAYSSTICTTDTRQGIPGQFGDV